ncbi:membrane-spanning 4-domains subfamily A member 4D [Amia ocellicauda]|uniref:membrane-spanning 4-domains subfamily A member 4D n=1 Tax=Amia ocellicauda TaxID=2972642 RepID=UPI0034641E9A|nr:M4A4D protein [Amia calva]
MTSSDTTEGGMRMDNQVHPEVQDTVPTSAPLAQAGLPHDYTSPGSAALKRFVKGQPTALGVVQIMIGLFTIGSGVLLEGDTRSFAFYISLPFWPSLLYIISGALSIAGEKSKRNNTCVIRAALTTNIISAVIAGIAISIFSIEITVKPTFFRDNMFGPLKVILLTLAVLEFCVAVSVSAFGCKAVCCEDPASVIVIQYQPNPQPGTQPTDPPACIKIPPPEYTE